jgi:hypothetical protein
MQAMTLVVLSVLHPAGCVTATSHHSCCYYCCTIAAAAAAAATVAAATAAVVSAGHPIAAIADSESIVV